MNPIQVKNNHDDCTVTVQVATSKVTDHTGTRRGDDEVCLVIEDETGFNVALFTPKQTAELIRILQAASDRVAAQNSGK